jgi:hypothetical protein
VLIKHLYQAQHAAKYKGLSHGFSKKKMNFLGISCDHPTNYRNCNRIDNMFISQDFEQPYSGIKYKQNGYGYYIPPQEMVDRLQLKINIVKTTSAIEKPQGFEYLYGNALNMSMRVFNGYQKKLSLKF